MVVVHVYVCRDMPKFGGRGCIKKACGWVVLFVIFMLLSGPFTPQWRGRQTLLLTVSYTRCSLLQPCIKHNMALLTSKVHRTSSRHIRPHHYLQSLCSLTAPLIGKIIRTVLCCIVYHNCTEWLHTHMSSSYRWTVCWFRLSFFVCVCFFLN